MRIKEKIVGNVEVLTVSGSMMGGPESSILHEKVKKLIENGIINVIVDLRKVKWINSPGIGVLMGCFTSLARKNGNLVLANATKKVKSILTITQLIEFFENYDSVDLAISRFSQN
jgi:anti-sigma B factor antagonist